MGPSSSPLGKGTLALFRAGKDRSLDSTCFGLLTTPVLKPNWVLEPRVAATTESRRRKVSPSALLLLLLLFLETSTTVGVWEREREGERGGLIRYGCLLR